MRIGILTHPLDSNYGGILQNYALQEVLRKMGHDPITLRTGKVTYYLWAKKTVKSILARIKGHETPLPIIPIIHKYRQSGLESFVRKYIKTTPKNFWYSSDLIDKYHIEALCVGSDKSWASYFSRIDDMFFSFARDYAITKFSYAPSFGTKEWEFNIEKTKKCRELIKSFSGVSVRERSGVRLCKEHLDADAKWLVDPTLLLSVSDYCSLCKIIEQRKDDYILVYILNYTDEKKKFIEKVRLSLKKKVILILAEKNIRINDTVENWIALFRDASYVITDSYHGTIFSVIFHKDFISLANPLRGTERFKSLSEMFSLDSNILMQIPDSFMPAKIEWNMIDEEIQRRQKEAMDFLKESLTKC